MEKKFYQTDTFKLGAGIFLGILIYKMVIGIFFK